MKSPRTPEQELRTLGRRAAIGAIGAGTIGAVGLLSTGPAQAAPASHAVAGPAPMSVIDVGAYGAVGDGVADDGPAIQAAIDAANAAGGGVVYLPTGEYRLTQTGTTDTGSVILKSYVTLRGDGYGSHIFLDPATTNPTGDAYFPLRVGTSTLAVTDVTVEMIRLTPNNKVINHGSMMGIYARHNATNNLHSDNVTVRNCTITDSQIAVGCSKSDPGNVSDRLKYANRNWRVENCNLDLCGNKMVELCQCHVGVIRDNEMTRCADGPQVLYYSNYVLIAGNHVTYTTSGINIAAGSHDIDIVNNIVEADPSIPVGTITSALYIRCEPTASNFVESDIRSIGNTYRDIYTTAKRVFQFGTRSSVISAVYERITFQNDIFDGNVQFAPLLFQSITTVKQVMFDSCRFDAGFATVSNATSASSEVSIRGCEFNGPSGYTLSASGYVLQNNRIHSVLSIGSSASATVAQGNIVTGGITDSGSGSVLANNVTV